EIKQELTYFRNKEFSEESIEEDEKAVSKSYQKLQRIFINIERIDQKREASLKKDTFSKEKTDGYHRVLKPCLSKISSTFFNSSSKIGSKVHDDIAVIDDYLNYFCPRPPVSPQDSGKLL